MRHATERGEDSDMLIHLHVQDFALIEKLDLQPDEGLTIITGETGAGKSILIDAILALLGSRMNRDMIRTGQPACRIEALLQLAPGILSPDLAELLELPADEPSELLLTREYNQNGRSVFRANDRIVTAATARAISASLFDIHGQHDNQLIFEPATHLGLLDRFAGEPVLSARRAWQEILREWNQCAEQLAELGSDPAARARAVDMLQYQIAEIEAAQIKPNEDELLQEQRRIRQNQERIVAALSEGADLLSAEDGGAVRALAEALSRVEYIARFSEKLAKLRQPLTEALELSRSVAADLSDALQRIDLDPHALERIDERLDVLYRLKVKYGSTGIGSAGAGSTGTGSSGGNLENVANYHRKAVSRLSALMEGEKRAQTLQAEHARIRERLLTAGQAMHAARADAAVLLSERICQELADLGMKAVRFSVHFAVLDERPPFRSDGMDRLEFLISPNPGEPERPLARIASGGEAARIMLAIKAILARADRTPILIFDEIDTGVSGQTALRVAEKLSLLALGRQVFCITHLPQIAAMADHHFLIEKHVEDGNTRTRLTGLDESGRLAEIARLLSGGTGAGQARSLAFELLHAAAAFRQSRSS